MRNNKSLVLLTLLAPYQQAERQQGPTQEELDQVNALLDDLFGPSPRKR